MAQLSGAGHWSIWRRTRYASMSPVKFDNSSPAPTLASPAPTVTRTKVRHERVQRMSQVVPTPDRLSSAKSGRLAHTVMDHRRVMWCLTPGISGAAATPTKHVAA